MSARAAAFWLRVRRLLRPTVPVPEPDYPKLLCDDAEQVDALDVERWDDLVRRHA